MRFAFIDAWKEEWSVEFLCRIMKVTSRGFRAWRVRPMSQRQRDDMVLLAHIREQHRLSLQSYGRPRMTEELQELGLNVGHGRVGRLMRENGIKVIRTQKYKATTDSDHTFNIAPNLLDQDFTTDGPNQKWAGDLERFQFSLKQGYRQCPESAEGVAGYWRSNINWKRFKRHLDQRRLAISGCHPRPLLSPRHRLGCQQSHETGLGDPGVGHGCGTTATARRLHSPYGLRVAILFQRVSTTLVKAWLQGLDERQG